MKKLIFSVFLSSLMLVSCEQQEVKTQVQMQPFSTSALQAKVDSIYKHLTPAERVAQIHGIRQRDLIVDGKLSLEKCRALIPNGVGQVSQFACMLKMKPNDLRDYVKDLQNYLIHETPSGIPAIFHEEVITGFATYGATTYPQQIGMACTWNPALMRKKTEYTAKSMRESGSFMALSPMVDIIRTPHFNRGEESYGEDCYLSSRMALAFVNGLQGPDLKTGVAACTKHFLGYGGGSESQQKELFEEILMPHEVAIRMGNSKNVMTGYHQFNGEYAAFNSYLIKDVLRDYLGFDGMMVSDYGAISQWGKGRTDQELVERAAKALNAGMEMEFNRGLCFPHVPEAIAQGLTTEACFEKAVKKALTLKVRLGLFDKDRVLYKTGDLDFDQPAYRKLAYQLATQSIVLLKNNGILPLKPSLQKVAIVGPNANTPWCMVGDYTYQSMFAFWQNGIVDFDYPKIHTLKDRLQSKVSSSIQVGYERGCDWKAKNESQVDAQTAGDDRLKNLKIMLLQTSDDTNWDKAIALSAKSDVILAAVGENPTLCGEGRDRKGIRLPGDQEAFVEALIATGKPVVLIMFGGRTQVLSSTIMNKAAAIVEAWYPGQEGADAVSDILLGNVNPSGKLCMSYINTEEKMNLCYNQGKQNNAKIAYPFGFGLSYTHFAYSDLQLNPKATIGGSDIKITCTVTNTGDCAGDEIVQLYVSPLDATIPLKPIQLKGFKRIHLCAGEAKQITFNCAPDLLAYYTEAGNWCVSPGNYEFKLGSSAADIHLQAKLTLGGKSIHYRNRRIFFSIVH